MVSRREKRRRGEGKSPAIRTQKDKRKLIVVSYLISLGESRATRNQILTKAFQLRKQEPGDFKELMNELEEGNEVTFIDFNGNIQILEKR